MIPTPLKNVKRGHYLIAFEINALCVLKCSHFTSVRTMPEALLVKVKKDELFFLSDESHLAGSKANG